VWSRYVTEAYRICPLPLTLRALLSVVPVILSASAETSEHALTGEEIHTERGDSGTEGEYGDDVTLLSEQGEYILEFEDVTRHKILERLLAANGLVVRWTGKFRDAETISGRYRGTSDEILRKLLSRYNYLIAYETRGARRHIASVLIFGPGHRSSGQAPPQPAQRRSSAEQSATDLRLQRARDRERILRRVEAASALVNTGAAVEQRRQRLRERLLWLQRVDPAGAVALRQRLRSQLLQGN
jgi:hypothetical protein